MISNISLQTYLNRLSVEKDGKYTALYQALTYLDTQDDINEL